MKIAIHFPVFKRYKITDLACQSLERVRSEFQESGIDSDVWMIGDDPKHQARAKRLGYNWVEAPNTPLGNKFNQGMKAIYTDEDWSHLMEFCSDNIFEESFASRMIEEIKKGSEYISLDGFYIMNWRSKEILLFRRMAWSNVGRITSRDVLNRVKRRFGYFYEPRIETRLDLSFHRMIMKVLKTEPVRIESNHPLIVDIKDQASMHGWSSFAAKPDIFPCVHLEGNFPELKTEENG